MDFVDKVKVDFPWLDETTAERLVERAKFFFFAYKFPLDATADENKYPIIHFKDEQWVLEACNDLAQRLGIDSATGYRENGISITWDNAKISRTLASLIVPYAGVIK